MLLSQISPGEAQKLSREQITKIVFDVCTDDGTAADAALLLGGNPTVCPDRADAAAKLYHQGRVRCIIPSGGVRWESDRGCLTEAELLRQLLLEAGVPDEVIFPETEAQTTIENMIFGTLQMQRRIGVRNIRRVILVTSYLHLNRSLRHARNYLPRSVEISGYCIPREDTDDAHWHLSEAQIQRVQREVHFLKRMVDQGLTEDIEF